MATGDYAEDLHELAASDPEGAQGRRNFAVFTVAVISASRP